MRPQVFFSSSLVLSLTFSVTKDHDINPTMLSTNTTFAAEMLQLYETERVGKFV